MGKVRKKEISKVLDEKRSWHDIKVDKPDSNDILVIRIYNPHYIYHEDEEEIYYAEDIKLAKVVVDYNNPNDESKFIWSIIPPYPKFDFSPLSKNDKLLEGTIVTHWAIPSEAEIDGWNSRFDITDAYINLGIDVDDDHALLLYRALMLSHAFIGQEYVREKSDEFLAFHIIIQDLLNLMDKNIKIVNGNEISLSKDYDPSNEDSGIDLTNEMQEIINSTKHMLPPSDISIDKIKEATSMLYSSLCVICAGDSYKLANIKNAISSFLVALKIDPIDVVGEEN